MEESISGGRKKQYARPTINSYNTHSQTRERTNGVVRNMNEWYDAFDITSGTLWLKPSERMKIW